MTEAEWLVCEDLEAMLLFVRTQATVSDRKSRLLGLRACFRRLFPQIARARAHPPSGQVGRILGG